MLKIRVKTTWQGKVGVRDRYVREALEGKEDIKICVGDEEMQIPFSEIKKKVVAKSEKPFVDRFSHESHYLFYFTWKPNVGNQKLF